MRVRVPRRTEADAYVSLLRICRAMYNLSDAGLGGLQKARAHGLIYGHPSHGYRGGSDVEHGVIRGRSGIISYKSCEKRSWRLGRKHILRG